MTRPFLIAELGTSHGGDMSKAFDMIAAAAQSGADCVKTQIVFADEILHPETGTVKLPGGDIPLFDTFKALERDVDFFAKLKAEAEKRGLVFLATPFGPRSASLLKSLNPTAVKIASPELNYVQLLGEVASWGIPIFLSTGVSTLADIENAIAALSADQRSALTEFWNNLTLLHCVTAYPAPPEDYNLRVINTLRSTFGMNVGVSDHSLDPVLVPSIAAVLGAAVVEKHFCLKRGDGGLDDAIALTPPDFAALAAAVKNVSAMAAATAAAVDESVGGGGQVQLQALDALRGEFGAQRVDAILGDGVKRLSNAEKESYGRTNRSIHAITRIQKGEIFSEKNIAILRTEKKLRPGLPPSSFESLLGRAAAKDIPAGEGVREEDR